MTSKERVLATISGKPTDHIASDFRAEPEVYQEIGRILNLPDEEAVRIWAKSDFRDLGHICNTGGHGGYNSFGWKDKVLDNGIQEDFWGVLRRKVSYGKGFYIDIVKFPLKNASGIEELRKYQFPDPRKIFDFSEMPNFIESLNKNNEYYTIIEGESLFDRCWALRGMEEFMMDLVAEPDSANYIIENNWRFFYEYTKMILESAKGKICAIGMYNDLGTQNGMMISPETYRAFFKERQKEYIKMVKSFGANVFYHSCGSILPIINDLIEIGVDILDPLQMKAMKVSPGKLSDAYGDKITFHGGLDTQDLLVNGAEEDVRSNIDILKKELGRFGKYILSCSHYLQIDVPFKNIKAIIEKI